MMNNVKNVPYYNDPNLQFEAIAIPYEESFSMAVILPYKSQEIMNMTNYLKPEHLQQVFSRATYEGVDYKIPRMKFPYSRSLVDALTMQGLKTLFEKADLTNMVVSNNLRVSDVLHAAKIEVDEKGTEAVSVTAVQFVTYSLDVPALEPKKFVANRPFMIAIFDHDTSIPVFAGLVHQPTGQEKVL